MKTKLLVSVAVVALVAFSSASQAVSTSIAANITFESAITLTKNADINFGKVTANQANTYKITTGGVVTTTGGAGTGVYLGGTTSAANVKITGDATQTINISASNYQPAVGVTPSLATCSYNGGTEVACTTLSNQIVSGTGKTLLIGASVTADGTQNAGSTATPTFEITVTYN